MASKSSLLIWISLLSLLFLHQFHYSNYAKQSFSSLSPYSLIARKVGATKFHFTPFHPQPGDNEIDPRYGVAKRLVPTGPNPLHH
ncbi:hypothetical protein CXB51_005258 [Gossypium anomalum]|uniref:Uncharacterized protein n=1 Tax=Gossypium anomalum TaxID=47600 RepID=A0A8J5ZFJ5_9ROSI|nr:hypothetical protein CXB51_005258 [Gossypium anomalum]